MLSTLFLAISSSIDSFGIGITYGIKNTKISLIGKIILYIIALIAAHFSIFFGDIIQKILPSFLEKIIGCLLLIIIGIYICFEALKSNKKTSNIFNNPISSDIDDSKTIDAKEAILLSIALSLDSLCIGIGGSMTDINLSFFPLLVATFQFLFLNLGSYIGIKINRICKLPENIWSILSGVLLIAIGIFKLW